MNRLNRIKQYIPITGRYALLLACNPCLQIFLRDTQLAPEDLHIEPVTTSNKCEFCIIRSAE